MSRSARRFVQAAGRSDKFQVADGDAIQVHGVIGISDAYLANVVERSRWLRFTHIPQYGRSRLDAKVKRVTAKGFEGVDMKLLLQPDSPLGQVEPGGRLGTESGAGQFGHPTFLL